MGRVSGKVALVTGGATGLGRADAIALVGEGAKVCITDINVAAGEALAAELNAAHPGSALFRRQDVTDEQGWIDTLAAIKATFGGLHILVNNAGMVKIGTPESASLEDFRRHQAVMSESVFLACKHALGLMKDSGGGSIINMSSTASHLGYPVFHAYGAAKGAVRAMTKSVAVWCQMQKYNIRVNSIHAGAMETAMVVNATHELGMTMDMYHQSPQGLGKPEDIANLVLFLASDESRFINGAELLIDNALTIQ